VRLGVHAPGGDLVEQRLPDVRFKAVDQRDLGAFAVPQLVAQRGGERQASRAASDDDDAMRRNARA
jgi:hypothetical protein